MGRRRIARSRKAPREQPLHDNDGSRRATVSTTCTLALRAWRISLLISPTSNWEPNLSHTRFPEERTFTCTMGNSPSTRS